MEKIGVRETQEKPRQIKKNSKGGGTGQKSREKYSRGRNREHLRRRAPAERNGVVGHENLEVYGVGGLTHRGENRIDCLWKALL